MSSCPISAAKVVKKSVMRAKHKCFCLLEPEKFTTQHPQALFRQVLKLGDPTSWTKQPVRSA